jgi:hypothetical protein
MTMNDNLTPEQVIESLNRMKMTPEERVIADAQEAGKKLGEIIANILILFIAPTIIWLALTYLVGFQVAWIKVFGCYFIFNFIKNIIVRGFKK